MFMILYKVLASKSVSVRQGLTATTQCQTLTVWYAQPLWQSLQYFQSCNSIWMWFTSEKHSDFFIGSFWVFGCNGTNLILLKSSWFNTAKYWLSWKCWSHHDMNATTETSELNQIPGMGVSFHWISRLQELCVGTTH